VESAKKGYTEVNDSSRKSLVRDYGGLIDSYQMDDAEVALITMGYGNKTRGTIVEEMRT